jgi:hypothetical protein
MLPLNATINGTASAAAALLGGVAFKFAVAAERHAKP